MKRWLPHLVLILVGAISLHAETVQEVYARGVRAYIAGDYGTAKILFAQILEADPNNKPAATYLRQIELAARANGTVKARAEQLIVPKIEFRETSLNTVLDWLPKLAEQQKQTLNIVRVFPKQYGDDTKITLQLTNVPMSSVLEYVAQIGGLKIDYQKNAIVASLPVAEKEVPAIQPTQ